MPNGVQHDIDMAKKLVDHLKIKRFIINIKDTYDAMIKQVSENIEFVTEQTKINLAPRIRMSALYAVSQSVNGRVANTCNLSEDWVGYATRYGDAAGDFSPLSYLTVTEVKEIGKVLELPNELVNKTPIDGLCGKTDEENLGFTYAVLDQYIRTGICENKEIKERIDYLNKINKFKLELMSAFKYNAK
jgi:NAD+ synthase